ncbi:MAG: galactokinase family protein [Thermoguttaceae bacterium]|jgi:galactokinase
MNSLDPIPRLVEHGLSPAAAERKGAMLARVLAAAEQAFGPPRDPPAAAFFVPGRIEVLGKHTDYAGGRSLLAAAEQGFCLVLWPREDDRIRVLDAVCGETIDFRFQPDLAPPVGHWSNYPMTVARRLARNFSGPLRGADVGFASDLPPAAGMSSSSALMVGIYLVLAEVNQLAARQEYRRNIASIDDLAGYLGTVENGQTFGSLEGDRGVGTFGGSEDHTAILSCQPGRLSQYVYAPVRLERVIPMPPEYIFAVGVSGVVAQKTGSAREQYNRASRLAAAVADLWRQATGRNDPHLAAALASGAGVAEQLRAIVRAGEKGDSPPKHKQKGTVPFFPPAALAARLEHFLVENEAVLPAAGDALMRGDLEAFGRWVDRSQDATENLLGNQVPETVYLARAAREQGAAAASAFGAGFGGSVWALVGAREADAFLARWAEVYRQEFPQHAATAKFFLTAAGPAAFRIEGLGMRDQEWRIKDEG